MATKKRKRRESFGMLDKLQSGRVRARYTGPDGQRYSAPKTFDALTDARAWLAAQQTDISTGKWQPPGALAAAQAERNQSFANYSAIWLASRTNAKGDHLRPRTRDEYRRLLDHPLAELAPLLVSSITPALVRDWRAGQVTTGRKTQTSRAYGLLNAIMRTALEDRLTDANPCTVKGGQSTYTNRAVLPPTDSELDTILASIDPRYRALVVVAAIGGLRYGEATALRSNDVVLEYDVDGRVLVARLKITKAAIRTTDGIIVGETKSAAGVRSVAIFASDAEIIGEHVAGLAEEALLFPARDGVHHLSQSSFWKHWNPARLAAKRGDMPFHALRHYAGTRYAQAGATPRETMARLGHSSLGAAMRYQHAGNRDDELAARMSRQPQA